MTATFLADPEVAPPGVTGRPFIADIVGVPTSPERVWALLGDTDRVNRIGGNGPVRKMEMRDEGDGLPAMVGEIAGPGGLPLPFTEAWMTWERGRFFRQVRTLRSPLMQGTDYIARLVPVGEGLVRPEVRFAVYGPAWAAPALKPGVGRMAAKVKVALDALGAPPPKQRALDRSALHSLDAWANSCDPEIAGRFKGWLEAAAPTALTRIRAFALADAWDMDREPVLDALLAGVDSGVVELYWSVRCTRCYGQVAATTSLSDLADHAECAACRVSFAADLGDNVEVLFAPHPSIFARTEERFCTMFPAGAPEQHGVWTLAPGQTLNTDVELSPGQWQLGAAGRGTDLPLDVSRTGASDVHWSAGEGAPFSPGTPAMSVRSGSTRLELTNDSPHRERVYLTRMGGEEPKVPASLLTTRPAFRRRFGHQVLAPDLRIAARSVALLFTDLSGSTAMYEEVGDARAFAVVRDHFTLLRDIVEKNRGTVVKTIGDAVMAAFYEPEGAVTAALSMRDAFPEWAGKLDLARPLSLKVGVHVGPALAVHSDQSGLDWFGGTVNLAARAQGAAGAGETMLTNSVFEHPGVQLALASRGISATPVDRELKGVAAATRLWRIPGLDLPSG